ncbi:MAG: hypothetical protein LBR61_09355 [Synergistaceae bacterium]|nr:hypothetical protein [Synergistaceae bacterium]
MTPNKANREYKSSVFVTLCEDKNRLVEVYNAVANKNYPPDAAVKIVTLENALFMGRRNDVSFLMEDRLVVMMEHQSTLCENMPLRLLIYVDGVYEKLLNADEKLRQALYGTKLLKIPKPEFYVFYNGKAAFPERKILKLSDAFLESPEADKTDKESIPKRFEGLLELSVPVYNINSGFNEEMLRKSETLSGYAAFVDAARHNTEIGYELEEAIRRAVNDCIERGILAEFLRSHSSEVINMLTAEFNLEDALKVWKEEGIEEGIEKNRIEVAQNMLNDGLPIDAVAKYTSLPREKVIFLQGQRS